MPYAHAERNLAATRLVVADTMRLLASRGEVTLEAEFAALLRDCGWRSSQDPTDGQRAHIADVALQHRI